jgi:hypothetical protein
MDADASRIRELERGFRRDGLPNLIVDLSATEDTFTRAIPFLTLVFVVEVMNALDVNAGWANLLLGLGGAVVLFGGFGLLNVVRGRRFLSIPQRVGIPELVVFVTLPALLPVLFSRQFLFGFTTILANVAILVLTYVVVGFGLVFIVWWVVVRLFALLGASVAVLVRAVPLLLFFSLVSFFTTEIWQVFTATDSATYWTAIGMFVLLGMGFLVVRLPSVVRGAGGVACRRRALPPSRAAESGAGGSDQRIAAGGVRERGRLALLRAPGRPAGLGRRARRMAAPAGRGHLGPRLVR